MFILDYRNAENPAHHTVEGVTLAQGALQAQVRSDFPLLEGGPMAGFSRAFDLPPIDLGSDAVAAVADWLSSEDGPYAGCPVVSDADLPLASGKLALSAVVKRKRDAVRDGGCTTAFGLIDTDINSRLNINGAVSMAAIVGEAFSIEWRMSDNSLVALDAADMTAVGVAVGQFVAACQARKNVLDAEIEAAETLAELEAINVDAGWPE